MAGSEALPEWLERVDHTADEGIIVRAESIRELLARAAWGMFSILTEMDLVRPLEETAVEIKAWDREELMVRWLSQLNFLHCTRHVVFCRFDVQEPDARHVAASVWGEPIDPARHVIHTEIKAVTFHGLEVVRDGPGWRARVLFDV